MSSIIVRFSIETISTLCTSRTLKTVSSNLSTINEDECGIPVEDIPVEDIPVEDIPVEDTCEDETDTEEKDFFKKK